MNENMDMVQLVCEDCGCIIAEISREEYDEILESEGFGHTNTEGQPRICVYGGNVYCEDCADNRFSSCSSCGELIDRENDEYAYDQHEEIYCEHCRDNELEWCERCESYTTQETSVVNSGGYDESWCDDCIGEHATFCDHCERYYDDRYTNFQTDVGGNDICEHCADRYFVECDECGDLVFRDDAIIRGSDYYCEHCISRVDEAIDAFEDEDIELADTAPEVIHSYHGYPNDWRFRNEANNGEDNDYFKTMAVRYRQLHIGPELEIDNGGCRNDKAIAITTAIGYPANESNEFKCSRDGSLNNGFEIIAMPATYDWHIKHYNWEAGLNKARELGYKSHDAGTCGLHFHVDRIYFENGMVNPEEGFIIITTNNMNWLKSFSRRTNYGFCRFIEASYFDVENFKADNASFTQRRLDTLRSEYRGHNVALNFANNSTIELRFVRGTLKYSTFKAAFQLTEMMSYAVKHFRKEQLATINLQWFKRFADRKGFTEFLAYIQGRGIMA